VWSWVYAQEVSPHSQPEWAEKQSHGDYHKTSLEKRDYLAYVQTDQQSVTFELRAVKGRTRWLIRGFSLAFAVLGITR